MTNQILLATKNQGKINELQKILNTFNIEVLSLNNYNIDEPEETGKTFSENSSLKAKYYGEKLAISAIADDSGLCVDKLNNFPSIYSARINNGNKDFTFAFNTLKLLLEYNNIEDYSAHFVCNISFYNYKTKNVNSFNGEVHGKLHFPPKGNNGFGYDSIFVPNGYDKTFAEFESEEKNKISHRADALNKFVEWFEKEIIY